MAQPWVGLIAVARALAWLSAGFWLAGGGAMEERGPPAAMPPDAPKLSRPRTALSYFDRLKKRQTEMRLSLSTLTKIGDDDGAKAANGDGGSGSGTKLPDAAVNDGVASGRTAQKLSRDAALNSSNTSLAQSPAALRKASTSSVTSLAALDMEKPMLKSEQRQQKRSYDNSHCPPDSVHKAEEPASATEAADGNADGDDVFVKPKTRTRAMSMMDSILTSMPDLTKGAGKFNACMVYW